MRKIKLCVSILMIALVGLCITHTDVAHASDPPASFTTTDGLLVDQGVSMQFWFDFNRTGFDRSTGTVTYKVTSRYYFSANAWLSTDELYVNGSYIGSFSSYNGRVSAGYGNRTESFTVTMYEGNNTIKTTGVDGTGGNTAKTQYIPKFREYTATFKNHDGTTLKTQTVQSSDSNYCATAPTNPTRTGYTFTGWDKGYCNFTSNITVTARYSANTYKVKYNGNGATVGSMSDSSHVYDQTKGLNKNTFFRVGWKFIGWNTKADGTGTNYTDQQAVKNLTSTNNATINLYAKWDEQPSITASDRTFYESEITSEEWKQLIIQNVSANDREDGDITSKVKITSNDVDPVKPGIYHVTYEVIDSVGQTVSKTISVTIKTNYPPVIHAEDKTYYEHEYAQEEWINELRMHEVIAEDEEDGDITNQIRVTLDNVEMDKVGQHRVVYEVTDAYGKSATKEIKVKIIYNNPPVIHAQGKTFYENEISVEDWKQEVLNEISVTDAEDGDLTSAIKVIKDNVDPSKAGAYEVVYEVTDSHGKTTQKTIDVTINENWEPVLQIFAGNKRFIEGEYTQEQWEEEQRMIGVSAHDREDADLTDQIQVVKDTTDPMKPGIYEVTYKVTDQWGKSDEKTIKVTVEENKAPEIFATDKYYKVTDSIKETDLLQNITAIDDRDGDISDQIEIIYSNVQVGVAGEYQVTYQVTDSLGKTTQQTINVYIADNHTPKPPLPDDKEVITIWNGRQLAQLSFTKEMESSLFDDDAYKDVVFGVYSAEDIYYQGIMVLKAESLIGLSHIDSNGNINIMLYHPGKYYAKELSTNGNYLLDDTKYYFEYAR